MRQNYRVGLTRDFLNQEGALAFDDIGLDALSQAAGVHWEFLAENEGEISAEQASLYDALLVLAPQVTERTFEGGSKLSLVARFGVGYDNVNVEACTRNGVMLTITPDGVRRPVAAAVLAFMLALSHKLLIKDRLTRTGRWDERSNFMGLGLSGKKLGVIGMGNIGREVLKLAQPFDMTRLVCDPYTTRRQADEENAELISLDSLLRQADFVAVCCALTDETHHLVNAARLALMKPTAFLINVARGPIVDQRALTAALQAGRLQGAGLDVFEQEPIKPNDPLLSLENVILSPHALCWTDECFLGNGRSAIQSILDAAAGRIPENVVNREVLLHAGLQERLAGFSEPVTL